MIYEFFINMTMAEWSAILWRLEGVSMGLFVPVFVEPEEGQNNWSWLQLMELQLMDSKATFIPLSSSLWYAAVCLHRVSFVIRCIIANLQLQPLSFFSV
jgi:hypothetical protein